MNSSKIGAIVVLYRPDLSVTMPAIRSLAPQVDEICIIDNTPDQDIEEVFAEIENAHYIPLNENKGIAAAQNIGIRNFLNCNYGYILFSDQDSVAPQNIVSELLDDYNWLKKNHFKVGIIGPNPINKCTGQSYSIKSKDINAITNGERRYVEKQYIISSFSLVPTYLYKRIGLFHEEFFIDFVDNEWCFRLKAKEDLSSYISMNCKILHELGKSTTFCGHQISISSPFRLFYQVRNYFWMRSLEYTPIEWKKQILKKLLQKFVYYPIIPSNRLENIKRMMSGLFYGLKRPKFKTYKYIQ